MAHYIHRDPATYDSGTGRRVFEDLQVGVGALPDDCDSGLVMVVMREPNVVNHERVLRLTIAEAMILQRNLGHAIDDIQKRDDARRPTAWQRIEDA